MKTRKAKLTLLASAFAGAMSVSAAMVYTDQASFLGAINPGSLLNEFDEFDELDQAEELGPSVHYSDGPGGQFEYVISSEPSLWGVSGAISVGLPTATLTISFEKGNVTAVGGSFFLTLIDGIRVDGTVKVEVFLSDSTSEVFYAGSFQGYITSASGPVITSLLLSNPYHEHSEHTYATLDHFYVGTAVPESTTMIAGVFALLPVGMSTLRILRKQHA